MIVVLTAGGLSTAAYALWRVSIADREQAQDTAYVAPDKKASNQTNPDGQPDDADMPDTPLDTVRPDDSAVPHAREITTSPACVVDGSGNTTCPICPAHPDCPNSSTCPEQTTCASPPTCPGQTTCPDCPSCPNNPSCPTCPACPDCPSCPEHPIVVSPFSEAKFEALSTPFDGATHEVVVTNAPAGTEIEYSNNRARDMGVHRAFARLWHEEFGEHLMTTTITIGKIDITGITFSGATHTFNNQVRNIFVSGEIPDEVEVRYEVGGKPFHGATNAGAYEVVAILSGSNYNELRLTATLTINKANISSSGFFYGSQTFEYDGSAHSLTITGAIPPTASVTNTYINASGVESSQAIFPGVYTAHATIGGPNHNPLVLTSTLTITNGIIRGITFPNHSAVYSGETHNFAVVGTLPAGVTVRYNLNTASGPVWNGAQDLGVYTVVATLSGDYYNTLTLTAQLSIVNQHLDQVQGIGFTGPSADPFATIFWDPVQDAGGYRIDVRHQDGTPIESFTVMGGDTEFHINDALFSIVLRGVYHVNIIALPKGGDAVWGPSLPSATVDYPHNGKLHTAKNPRIENGFFMWDPVDGAQRYDIRVNWHNANGQIISSDTASLAPSFSGNAVALQVLISGFGLTDDDYVSFSIRSTTAPSGLPSAKHLSDWSARTQVIRIGDQTTSSAAAAAKAIIEDVIPPIAAGNAGLGLGMAMSFLAAGKSGWRFKRLDAIRRWRRF
ncbi:MBG domain-containing protein [Candidatus Saccharibacteria bacterium]|nr:MBG domain-containing protein [Candidatus Saccharibacteria bacterium]